MTLDTRLAKLDPARGIPDDLVKRPRARATLDAILATQVAEAPAAARRTPSAEDTAPARRTTSTRHTPSAGHTIPAVRGIPAIRPRRRALRYAVAAGVVGLAAIVGPAVLGGSTAYATWTATARPADAAEQARWGSLCQSAWTEQEYAVRLVELRGRHAYAVLTGTNGAEATCLMTESASGSGIVTNGFAGSLPQSPDPSGLVTNSVRSHDDENGNTVFEVSGKAGTRVTSIVFEAAGMDVTATLENGYFAAWWPADTSLVPRWGPPDPKVRITLDDGTTRTVSIQEFDVSPL